MTKLRGGKVLLVLNCLFALSSCQRKKVVTSKIGKKSHGRFGKAGTTVPNHHINMSTLTSIFDTLPDDSEGLISLIYQENPNHESSTRSTDLYETSTSQKNLKIKESETEGDYNGDNDPLDLAGQHADLDFVINTVNEHKEKMLQKPNLYTKDLKRLDAALPVGVQLTVENIESVSSEKMDLTLTFVLKQIWLDKRLAHGGKGKVHVPSKIIGKIWIPDIIIQNAKTTSMHSTLSDNYMMKIGPNGEMEYSIKMSSTIICQMQLTNFPMDRQLCALSLYSFAFSGSDLCLYWSSSPNLFNEHSIDGLSNFYLEHYTNRITNMTDCGTPNEPNCEYKFFLTLEFEFKRMFMSVFFTSYLPAMVMVILGGMATFIDPKSSPARVTLGITTVLTISTVIQGVKTLLPQVNYLTALDVYLWVCFFFVCITLIEYVYRKW